MGFIKARGHTFYYEELGEGTPILLIPPAGSTASTWVPWPAIWPGPAGSSPTTGVGTPGRGARLSARPPSIRAMPRHSWKH